MAAADDEERVLAGGSLGPGEKASPACSTSISRMWVREVTESQGGGMMLARRCFLRRSASQRERGVGKGGLRGFVGPWEWCQASTREVVKVALIWERSIEDVLPCSYTPGSAQGRLTPSRSRP